MSEIKDDLRYTENHEWVRLDGTTATIGITDYAQESLGEIVYVELPEIDDELSKGDEAASIESVKAAAPVYAPLGGRVSAVNEDLEDSPEQVNESPYEAYIYVLDVTDAEEFEQLMDSEAYESFLQQKES